MHVNALCCVHSSSRTQIRLQFSGRNSSMPSSGGDEGYGLVFVEVLGPPPAPPKACEGNSQQPTSAETLSQLQLWLSATARAALHHERQGRGSGSLSEVYEASIRALSNLARCSGSLSCVLLLCNALVSGSAQRTLSGPTVESLAQLMHAIRLQVRALFDDE